MNLNRLLTRSIWKTSSLVGHICGWRQHVLEEVWLAPWNLKWALQVGYFFRHYWLTFASVVPCEMRGLVLEGQRRHVSLILLLVVEWALAGCINHVKDFLFAQHILLLLFGRGLSDAACSFVSGFFDGYFVDLINQEKRDAKSPFECLLGHIPLVFFKQARFAEAALTTGSLVWICSASGWLLVLVNGYVRSERVCRVPLDIANIIKASLVDRIIDNGIVVALTNMGVRVVGRLEQFPRFLEHCQWGIFAVPNSLVVWGSSVVIVDCSWVAGLYKVEIMVAVCVCIKLLICLFSGWENVSEVHQRPQIYLLFRVSIRSRAVVATPFFLHRQLLLELFIGKRLHWSKVSITSL